MRNVIIVSGKAKAAFALFDSICQEYGNLTLGELARKLSRHGYWIMWRAEE